MQPKMVVVLPRGIAQLAQLRATLMTFDALGRISRRSVVDLQPVFLYSTSKTLATVGYTQTAQEDSTKRIKTYSKVYLG